MLQAGLDADTEHSGGPARLEPDNAVAHYNLGSALEAQKKLDNAVDEYRTAIRLKPDGAGAHCNLGRALGQQGKNDGSPCGIPPLRRRTRCADELTTWGDDRIYCLKSTYAPRTQL
jgi:tetratricopeptide (TPR) repeat protein